METNNTTNNIAKIRVIFFKENGKYYTEDTVVIPSDDMQVFQIVDWIKDNLTLPIAETRGFLLHGP